MQLSFRERRKGRQACADPLQFAQMYVIQCSKEQYHQHNISMPLKRKFLLDSFILKI